MAQINIKKTNPTDISNPSSGKIAFGVNDSGITLKNEYGDIISIGSSNTGTTVDLSAYYTSAQTNVNFLSANTSLYTQSQTNENFTSALTFNSHVNDSTIHFTKSDININDLGDVNTTGVYDGYFLSYSAGTWVPVISTNTASTDFTNYYNKTQTNNNFLSASTLYEFIVPIDYDWSLSSSIQSSTTFLIEYNFDLSGQTITLPYNSNIKFTKDGALKNTTIVGNNSYISSDEHGIGILYNTTLTGGTFINMTWYPEWFGYLNSTNWHNALQTAINCAQPKAGEVKLSSKVYQFQEKIKIYAGVSVNGVSRGETAFSIGPTQGSLLYCTSSTTSRAVEVYGKFVTLSNFSIKCESRYASNIDGLVINGVGDGVNTVALIESLNFDNLLIHSCRKGMYLVAGNSGAVTYSSFNNIRIRDCQYHLKIEVLSDNPIYGNLDDNGNAYINENAFINSNKWSSLFLSGFALAGIWIETQKKTDKINSQDVYLPANNLLFDNVVIEPPYSSLGHLIFHGGGSQARMNNIRIEASQQNSFSGGTYQGVPVVYLGEKTSGNVIDLDQASITVVDLGYNNKVKSKGSKISIVSPDSDNLYKNSALVGLKIENGTYILPEWTIQEQCVDPNNTFAWRTLQTGSSVTIEYNTGNTRQDGYKALSFVVPPKYQLRIYQDLNRDFNRITNASVNAFVIAEHLTDVQWTYQDAVTPILSSSASFGPDVFSANTYEPIGGWFPVTSTELANYYRIAVFVQNIQATGGTNINFTVTQPQFVKGANMKQDASKYLTDMGGTVYGLLGRNIVEGIKPSTNPDIYLYSGSTGSLLLPREGSVFYLEDSSFLISRINYNINRFGRGSEITLIFKYAGISVTDSAFISLSKPYISEVESTLTLYSKNGDGLWQEINRYSKKDHGYTTYEFHDITGSTSGYYEIPITGDKYINLTNVSANTISIQRINYINRFDSDTKLHLEFNSTNSLVTISNTPYITLSIDGSYYPQDGDWLDLVTVGNGTWVEVARKQSTMKPATIGNSIVDVNDVISGVIVTLPITGENTFTMTNTGGTAKIITRLNDNTNKFSAGSIITLDFTTLTSPITISNTNYISLTKAGEWVPSTGDWIQLMTKGNGTWVELNRKELTTPNATLGTLSSEATLYISGTTLNLPRTGENSFTLTNTAATAFTVNRINDLTSYRFTAGSVVLLDFASLTSAITLVNSTYINLTKTGSYTPTNGDWITLYTKGNGTWTELSRKPSLLPYATEGYQSVFIENVLSSNILTLPLTGGNYFAIDCTHSGGTVSRINQVSGTRFDGGKVLNLEFTNLTNTPTLSAAAGYIVLSTGTTYVPSSSGTNFISFITRGDGIWRELSRATR